MEASTDSNGQKHTFTIQFRGLICHIGTPTEKTHATVVKATGHVPKIIFNGREEPLDRGDHIFFDLPGGTAKPDQQNDFTRFVPGLQPTLEDTEPTDKDLRNEVKDKDPHPNVAAHLTFPEGHLHVGPFMPRKLRLGPADKPIFHECVAAYIEFRVAHDMRSVTMRIEKDGHTRLEDQLAPGAFVEVSNRASGDQHFHHYRDLTKADRIAKASDGDGCSMSRWPPDEPNPECSNSQWP